MEELDADENNKSPTVEKTVEETMGQKPVNKAHASVMGQIASEPDSESSTLAGDEIEVEVKSKPPRKLMEDEKRAKGRIAWEIWTTYFKVSSL